MKTLPPLSQLDFKLAEVLELHFFMFAQALGNRSERVGDYRVCAALGDLRLARNPAREEMARQCFGWLRRGLFGQEFFFRAAVSFRNLQL